MSAKEFNSSLTIDWAKTKLAPALEPQGFVFSQKLDTAEVEFTHPVGLSGSLSYSIDPSGKKQIVLFTCNHPDYKAPVNKTWKDTEDSDIITNMRGALALALVYKGVTEKFKSSLLTTHLGFKQVSLNNPKKKSYDAVVLDLTVDAFRIHPRIRLSWRDNYETKNLYYPISATPTVINTKKPIRLMVERANVIEDQIIQTSKKENFLQCYTELVSSIPGLRAKQETRYSIKNKSISGSIPQFGADVLNVVVVECLVTGAKIDVMPTPSGAHIYSVSNVMHQHLEATKELLSKVAGIDITQIKDKEYVKPVKPPVVVDEVDL